MFCNWKLRQTSLAAAFAFASAAAISSSATAQNLVVQGSLCVGNDCPAAPAFGFDTIRLQENNLRIHFDDTSVAASFPRNDWRLVANDSANGGASYFAIEDATAGRQVFRVEAGARTNALTVDAQGDVGIGLLNAVVDLHIRTGNTPTLRLEQDGSSGFTPQTWDVAGNEANFFIRDATSGSTLPFRIFPGAPSNALTIEATTGDIGMGTTSPTANLHVLSTVAGETDILKLVSNGGSFITMDNTATNDSWFITHQNGADETAKLEFTSLLNAVTANVVFELQPDGNATLDGILTQNSDKNAKMAIEKVDEEQILQMVSQLEISEWSYKKQAGVRHIGPMAQDFYALFGTGASETGIATIDTSGVALASIKAMARQLREKEARLAVLEASQREASKLAEHLRSRLEALESAR